MTGLQVFYDGDFDQAMEEAGPATKENINDAMGAYIAMFHESFFLIDGPSISVSNEAELVLLLRQAEGRVSACRKTGRQRYGKGRRITR